MVLSEAKITLKMTLLYYVLTVEHDASVCVGVIPLRNIGQQLYKFSIVTPELWSLHLVVLKRKHS